MIPRLSLYSIIIALLFMYVGYKWGGKLFPKVGL